MVKNWIQHNKKLDTEMEILRLLYDEEREHYFAFMSFTELLEKENGLVISKPTLAKYLNELTESKYLISKKGMYQLHPKIKKEFDENGSITYLHILGVKKMRYAKLKRND